MAEQQEGEEERKKGRTIGKKKKTVCAAGVGAGFISEAVRSEPWFLSWAAGAAGSIRPPWALRSDGLWEGSDGFETVQNLFWCMNLAFNVQVEKTASCSANPWLDNWQPSGISFLAFSAFVDKDAKKTDVHKRTVYSV